MEAKIPNVAKLVFKGKMWSVYQWEERCLMVVMKLLKA